MQCRKQPALLRMQRRPVVDGAGGRLSHPALSDVQAGFGVRRQRPQGRARHQVYFVKQLQVRDQGADDSSTTRLIPMMREYTVFNVDQCDNLPDRISTGKPIRVRNPDTRDELADDFLRSTGADLREGSGEALYVPSRDFISMPAFAGFKTSPAGSASKSELPPK
jgi:antirestriction protein ArdC